MTTGMTATDASTAQEGPDYGVHDYYKDYESISTNEYRRRRLILQVWLFILQQHITSHYQLPGRGSLW